MLTVIRSEGRFKIPAVRRSSHNTNPTIAESAHWRREGNGWILRDDPRGTGSTSTRRRTPR